MGIGVGNLRRFWRLRGRLVSRPRFWSWSLRRRLVSRRVKYKLYKLQKIHFQTLYICANSPVTYRIEKTLKNMLTK